MLCLLELKLQNTRGIISYYYLGNLCATLKDMGFREEMLLNFIKLKIFAGKVIIYVRQQIISNPMQK